MFPRNDRSGSRRRAFALIAALSLGLVGLLPGLARADRASLGASVNVTQEHDDNVYSDEDDERSSLVTFVTPGLRLRQEGDRGHAFVDVGLRSRTYWSESDLDTVDRFGRLDLERKLTPRATLFSTARVDLADDADTIEDDGRVLQGGRDDARLVEGSLGMRYAIGLRTQLTTSVSYAGRDYGDRRSSYDQSRRDSDFYLASATLQRVLGLKDVFELNAGYQRNRFDDLRHIPLGAGETTDDVYSATASWRRQWSARWRTVATGGVRRLRSEQEDAVVNLNPIFRFFPPSLWELFAVRDDTTSASSGLIGSFSLTRAFRRSQLDLGVSYLTQATGGLGSTLDTTSLTGAFSHRMSERVTARLDARYDKSRSAMDDDRGFDRKYDFEYADIALRLDWRARKRWLTFAYARFAKQRSDGDLSVQEYDRMRVGIGLQYFYDHDL